MKVLLSCARTICPVKNFLLYGARGYGGFGCEWHELPEQGGDHASGACDLSGGDGATPRWQKRTIPSGIRHPAHQSLAISMV